MGCPSDSSWLTGIQSHYCAETVNVSKVLCLGKIGLFFAWLLECVLNNSTWHALLLTASGVADQNQWIEWGTSSTSKLRRETFKGIAINIITASNFCAQEPSHCVNVSLQIFWHFIENMYLKKLLEHTHTHTQTHMIQTGHHENFGCCTEYY